MLDWCEENQMKLNKNKSHIVYFENHNTFQPEGLLGPSDEREIMDPEVENRPAVHGIKYAKEAKYLGVIIDEDLKFESQIVHWMEKTESKINGAWRLWWFRGGTWKVRVNI